MLVFCFVLSHGNVQPILLKTACVLVFIFFFFPFLFSQEALPTLLL